MTVIQITLAGPGVCERCGCTDGWACAGGCFWINDAHTLCSACATDFERAERFDVDICAESDVQT